MPLFVERRIWGAITLYADRAGRFDQFDQVRAGEIGGELSFGLERMVRAGELYRLSHSHPLSGLPSRLHFDERITARATAGLSGTVVLLHLDRLDEINSAYGGPALLAFLKQVAERLAALVAGRMQLSHIGTGRFALLIGSDEQIDVPSFIASSILPLVQGSYTVHGERIWCSVNAGAATLPDDGNNADMLLVKAWEALAAARGRGDGFAAYSHDAARTMLLARQLVIEAELRDAIARREFVTYYQPKVDLASGQINGAEALVRWSHPRRGLVPPLDFIPLLERTGLIVAVGRQVLEQAMTDWRRWREAGLRPPTIAVNVAPAQFRSPTLLGDIEHALLLAGPAGQPLEIEITESSLDAEQAKVVETLNDIRSLDVAVAIDDFGTGYSSLAYLVTLPVDVLKVDRSFVQQMAGDPRYLGLVSTIITLGHNLGLRIVAEGIETEEQAAMLRQLKCEQGQGFLYGRPLPAGEFEALLRLRL
jgi:EAL domain-containing protein (putative c-di-GMP-specific phosphodiesterase class I)/GGDEF domain-containing protein